MARSGRPKSGGAKTRRAADVPWWLAGDELCPHCEQGYACETERRCAECDEPMCALCAARERERILCPGCVAGA